MHLGLVNGYVSFLGTPQGVVFKGNSRKAQLPDTVFWMVLKGSIHELNHFGVQQALLHTLGVCVCVCIIPISMCMPPPPPEMSTFRSAYIAMRGI